MSGKPALSPPIVVSGTVGPRGDAYGPGQHHDGRRKLRRITGRRSRRSRTGAADLITAYTLTYASEAVGIVRAARSASIPAVISFTLETDGRLPAGQPLREAIEEVDAETGKEVPRTS